MKSTLLGGIHMNEALAEQIAWYLDLNKREKQLSPHTIKAYHIDLKQFLSFVGGRAVECPRFLSGIGIQ